MAAALILAIQLLFGANAASQPTSAQLQVAASSIQAPSGIVVQDQSIVQ
ncbi:MAG: hypothetical protein ABI778_10565 [Ignavibacteriota bacterium]